MTYFAQEVSRHFVSLDKKPYLTLQEAKALSNIPLHILRQYVKEGKIKRGPGRQFIVKTQDVLRL